jgi:hypothetical protein
MPQMRLWPFMARTMVDEVHGVKVPLAPHATLPPLRSELRHLTKA